MSDCLLRAVTESKWMTVGLCHFHHWVAQGLYFFKTRFHLVGQRRTPLQGVGKIGMEKKSGFPAVFIAVSWKW